MSRSLLFSSLKKSFTNLSKSIDLNDMQNQPNHHDLLKAVSESAISHQMIHKIDDSLASAAINLKLESKVKSLERVIERMESAHANTLVGLHKEVERLSNLVSEMMLVMATEGSVEGIKKVSRSDSVQKFLSDPSGLRSDSVADMYKVLENIQPLQQMQETTPSHHNPVAPLKESKDAECQTDFSEKAKKAKAKKVDHATETIAIVLASHETQTVDEAVVKVEKATTDHESAPQDHDKKDTDDVATPPNNLDQQSTVAQSPNKPHGVYSQDKETDESIFLLVQKEKKKFNALVERVSEEKKRRQAEIDSLKSEMKTLKSVLKLAGLSYDVKGFKDILQAHQEQVERLVTPITVVTNKDLLASTAKTSILPPIPAAPTHVESKISHPFDDDEEGTFLEKDMHATIHELQQDQHHQIHSSPLHKLLVSNEDHQYGGGQHQQHLGAIQEQDRLSDKNEDFASEAGQTLIAPLPPPLAPPPNAAARKNRYKQVSSTVASTVPVAAPPSSSSVMIPAILQHNQNLDYQGRAHIYLDNVVLERSQPDAYPLEVAMAMQSAALSLPASQRSPLLSRVFAKAQPPAAAAVSKKEGEKTSLPPLQLRSGEAEEAAKMTSYAGRLWRSKIVKSKQLKSLENKF